jgi:lipopolysaccharide export system protein LptA
VTRDDEAGIAVLAADRLFGYRAPQLKEARVRVTSIAGILVAGHLAMAGMPAAAQGQGPFGGFKHDRTAPIEITSDALEVRQAENLAIFSGEVVAGQGTLRLTADRVEVAYDEAEGEGSANASGGAETGAIRNMQAEGNVFISNGAETAQGERAEYDVDEGVITMTGSVVLTQGENVISGQTLVINLNEGQGRMQGRVKSIFTPQRSGQGTN